MGRDKVAAKKRGDQVSKPQPLLHDIIKQHLIYEGEGSGAPKHTKKRKRADDNDEELVVDKKQAKRIFKQARAQIVEDYNDQATTKTTDADLARPVEFQHESDDITLKNDISDLHAFSGAGEEEVLLDDADRCALDAFFYDDEAGDSGKIDDDKYSSYEFDDAAKLSDIVKEKRTELNSMIGGAVDRGASGRLSEADFETWKSSQSEQVLSLYAKVREVLARYRSGKIPKAFKIVPALDDATWRHFLELLEPTKWTARAMYEATRLFASNLNERRAEAFFRAYLLPRVRDDIAEFGKLNSHLFAALKRAVYKPAAFIKGILLPLLGLTNDRERSSASTNLSTGIWCTNREAYVFAAVLSRLSLPMLHAAAAVVKMTTTFIQLARSGIEQNGDNDGSDFATEFFRQSIGPFSLIVRALVEKRYALPFRALGSLVDWFVFVHSFVVAFSKTKRSNSTPILTVIWYQCALAFVERYATQLTSEQLASLLATTEPGLLSCTLHRDITPAIRRVLLNAIQNMQ